MSASDRLWSLFHRASDLGVDPLDDPDVVVLLEQHPDLLEEVAAVRARIQQIHFAPHGSGLLREPELTPPLGYRLRWASLGAAAAMVFAVWWWWPRDPSSDVAPSPRRDGAVEVATPPYESAPAVVVHSLHVEWRRSGGETDLVSYRKEPGVVVERRATSAGIVSRTTQRVAELEDEE